MPIEQKRRESYRDRAQRDLRRYGEAILHSEEMRQAFQQKHHKLSTVGDHTMRVALSALGLCYALRRLHIAPDIPTVVTGSLCHDLGILGRDEKYLSQAQCLRQHPADSVEAARRLVGELPEKTEDAIARHMWPFAGSKMPNSLEGAIVSAADKIASFEDYTETILQKAAGKLRERRERPGRKECLK